MNKCVAFGPNANKTKAKLGPNRATETLPTGATKPVCPPDKPITGLKSLATSIAAKAATKGAISAATKPAKIVQVDE